ncbi:MAG: DUF3108 domain-containing protein [Gammaproteobacteria bacterium]
MRLTFPTAAFLMLAAPAFAASPDKAPPAATSASALPATLAIPAFEMHYRVSRNGWHIGEATFTLERDGDGWHFHSKAQATGIASWFVHSTFKESSRFDIVNHRIQPLEYSYRDTGSPSHNETIHFDWAAGQASDRKGDKKPEQVAIAAGMVDRLSAQLKITRQLAAGVPLSNPYRIVHDGKVDDYHLKRDKREKVTTSAGKFETVLVVRRDPHSGRANRFWMAPKYDWLPVKMDQIEPDGTTYTFSLTRLKWLSEAKAKK